MSIAFTQPGESHANFCTCQSIEILSKNFLPMQKPNCCKEKANFLRSLWIRICRIAKGLQKSFPWWVCEFREWKYNILVVGLLTFLKPIDPHFTSYWYLESDKSLFVKHFKLRRHWPFTWSNIPVEVGRSKLILPLQL